MLSLVFNYCDYESFSFHYRKTSLLFLTMEWVHLHGATILCRTNKSLASICHKKIGLECTIIIFSLKYEKTESDEWILSSHQLFDNFNYIDNW